MSKLIDKANVPELAKLLAYISFAGLSDTRRERKNYFVRSFREVAKQEKYADSMQTIFEKTINDILPKIMVDDRVEKFNDSLKSKETRNNFMWWIDNMVKLCYNYLSKDPILKKAVDEMAAVISKRASKDDFDFSKL